MDQLRTALAGRLDRLAAERPDLGAAIALQRTLLSRQIDLLDVLRTGGVPGLSLPAGYVAAKLKRGIPVFHAEPIPLPGTLLEKAAREFCDRLAAGGAAEAASGVARAMDARTLDPAALISACFGRDQRRVRSMAARESVSPDLAWLVAELAVAPFAHLLHVRALPAGHEGIAAAMRGWDRGFCPACGSWPAVVEAIGGRHALRCSFCAAAWALAAYRCVYCGNDGETFLTAAPDPEQPGRRLQACGACGGYVKVLEAGEPAPFPLVAIDDLASMDLDMAAIEKKYMRPALPEISRTAG